MNKTGATLLETVLYVSLFSIVSILIGSQVNSIMKNFSSGIRTSLLQTSGRDALAGMSRKIKNTGFKSYLAGTTLIQNPGALYADSSSFIAREGTPADTLTTLQVNIDRQGKFVSVDTTMYFLDGTNLCMRTGSKTTVVSPDVYALQFQYGILGADSVLLSEDPINSANWTLSGCTWGTGPGVITTSTSTTASIECQKSFSMPKTCRVSVKFKVEPGGGTMPADSMLWSIKSAYSGSLKGSASFKPISKNNEIVIPLPSLSLSKLSLNFTRVRSGEIKISYVNLRIIDRGEFSWVDKPVASQNRFVRAIRIHILSRSAKKTNSTVNTPVVVGNDTIPRNGPYSWRLNTEIVETPNNGLF
ncbi:MAG TPA: hypothetical protein VHO70_11165 [Chitinispirillaceae bacterium]|nr:hypothetical protein [Chitinispirillaceae bacterium]